MLQLPYKPTNVSTAFGAKVLEVKRVFHREDKPQGGYSRDYWLYDCTVQHEDGKVTTGTVDPGQMCYDNPAGFEEIKALSEVMTDYLNKHGTWNEKAPRGWYAHRKAKATA